MSASIEASRILAQEALALLARLKRIQPFVSHMPMVPAARVSLAAQAAIERYTADSCHKIRKLIYDYLRWLNSDAGRQTPPEEAHRRLAFLRLRFNAMLSQFDIFADVLTQRSEHNIGVWLAGLDALASDALELPGHYYRMPPVMCYLDRGLGAAIRRARTRLPGGGKNPVAIIRVPRERMIGSGIASSIVHEVGHQGSALLDLVNSLRAVLKGVQKLTNKQRVAWILWERWISEILADFWSVAKLGITSTLGLLTVVGLPRPFVFRVALDDPHPVPWIRVKLSCAMGSALYPNTQWRKIAELWESFYPKGGLGEEKRRLLGMIEFTMPRFVEMLINYRPKSLRGKSLMEAMSVQEHQPNRLTACYRLWQSTPAQMRIASPTLAFAVIGQARIDGKISPQEESQTTADLLRHWALHNSLDTFAAYRRLPIAQAQKLAT